MDSSLNFLNSFSNGFHRGSFHQNKGTRRWNAKRRGESGASKTKGEDFSPPPVIGI
jgi:hypothetical protein